MRYLILIFFLFLVQFSFAQNTYRSVKRGNSEVENGNFTEAEIQYRKALEKEPNNVIPQFNLGNAKYLQANFEEATTQFESNVEAFTNKQDKADAYHNWGNSLLEQKKYEESIDAYKEALKLIPGDMDTKYNLAYAQEKLKKEQQQQEQNQEQDQEEKQDQDSENKDENKEGQEGEEKEKEDGDPKDQEGDDGEPDEKEEGEPEKEDKEGERDEGDEKEEQEEKQAQPKEAKLTKEQAEQLLRTLENQEGKLQEKLDEPEGEPVYINIEKDW